MSETVPAWTTVAAFIIVVAGLSVIGLTLAAIQLIVKELRNKNKDINETT
tara:strand:+ start:213 stop:362 length:150 start_codon:yes stop_codon:yes gene_type:complete